jgi:hypothetical protein
MTAPSASFFSSLAVEAASAERMGEGTSEGVCEAASEMSDGEAESEMVGCESPRRTRLIEVGL